MNGCSLRKDNLSIRSGRMPVYYEALQYAVAYPGCVAADK